MTHLSLEAKQNIVKKALNRGGSRTLKEVAKEHGIGHSTLQKWITETRQGKLVADPGAGASLSFSRAERFQHLVMTSKLDGEAISTYCREQGLYTFQLDEWRTEFMNEPSSTKQPSRAIELRKSKAKNKQLERELRRKDKALAEVSALLVLKKKVDLLWGDNEDA